MACLLDDFGSHSVDGPSQSLVLLALELVVELFGASEIGELADAVVVDQNVGPLDV